MILSFVPHPRSDIHFSSHHLLAMVNDVEKNGVVVKATKFEDFDSSVFLNSVVSSDFSVNNLLSIGATNLLKRNYSGQVPSVKDADVFDSIPSDLLVNE